VSPAWCAAEYASILSDLQGKALLEEILKAYSTTNPRVAKSARSALETIAAAAELQRVSTARCLPMCSFSVCFPTHALLSRPRLSALPLSLSLCVLDNRHAAREWL
jgi:hypothetical protein